MSAVLALCALACGEERASVGEVTCARKEHELCAPHEREVLSLQVQTSEKREASAELLWQHVQSFPECTDSTCVRLEDFLVHEDGGVMLAGTQQVEDRTRLWVAALDATGAVLSSSVVPEADALLRTYSVLRATLIGEPDGRVLLVVGLRMKPPPTDGSPLEGSLLGLTLARTGAVEASFEIETGDDWPTAFATLESDIIVGRGVWPSVGIMRYRRRGEPRWQQLEVARIAGPDEVGLDFEGNGLTAAPELLGLAVDGRQRIWGALLEGVFGIVQLDPDGAVAWHGLGPQPLRNDPSSGGLSLIAIDSRDRPLFAFDETVLRIEADGSRDELRMPLAAADLQENFYAPTIYGLGVDAQDRVYLGMQDGPRSARRLVIDRLSADLRDRERFAIPLEQADANLLQIRGLRVGRSGDVYVHVSSFGNLFATGDTVIPGDVNLGARILRLHLDPR